MECNDDSSGRAKRLTSRWRDMFATRQRTPQDTVDALPKGERGLHVAIIHRALFDAMGCVSCVEESQKAGIQEDACTFINGVGGLFDDMCATLGLNADGIREFVRANKGNVTTQRKLKNIRTRRGK